MVLLKCRITRWCSDDLSCLHDFQQACFIYENDCSSTLHRPQSFTLTRITKLSTLSRSYTRGSGDDLNTRLCYGARRPRVSMLDYMYGPAVYNRSPTLHCCLYRYIFTYADLHWGSKRFWKQQGIKHCETLTS